ncbi:hypothetical protein SNE35_03310 [Paucibacter sp. R3-3]|uniref:DUF2846 domain-containing protein n=1 Tax=Roseateles agri TaxID=3098619 RepID=A0ABU5DB63_9BURK|nr:hypothetical protein [Paucibacter sp. R3-3]MDY0743513.1 hypothetical protein [Paucibacter sp. R3-3]
MYFHQMSRIAIQWIGLFLTTLLGACSGTPVSPNASASDIGQKAIVLISVSHDQGAGNGANAIFYLDESRYPGRVVMKSIQDNLSIPVKSDFRDRRGHLYVLELEPGSHTIDGWQVASAGARISAPVEPLQFEVKRGEVLYLGNLHAKLVLGHGMLFGARSASNAMPVVVDRHEEDIALAEARVPAMKGQIRVALLSLGPLMPVGEASKRYDPVVIPKVPTK